MSRTVVCPKCDGFAVLVEKTEDRYVVKCKNCGEFKITGSEELKAHRKYKKRMGDWKKVKSILNQAH